MIDMKKKYTDNQLVDAVKNSHTLQEVLNRLNLIGGHGRIKAKILDMGLDTSHWENFSGATAKKRKPLEEILQVGPFINTHSLKIRLINNGYFLYECSCCKLTDWNEKSISLQLDHINGNRRDNRIENLRLLCPNCHSQTETFCGKNIRGVKLKKDDAYKRYPCIKCNKLLQRYQNKLKLCPDCRKTEYGGKLLPEQLLQLYIDYDSKSFFLKDLLNKYAISSSTLYNLLSRRCK